METKGDQLKLSEFSETVQNEPEKKLYSHSKLWLFESCPEAYKIKYIDKAWPEMPKSIELFLGDFVHQSLEWLYENAVEGKAVDMDELILHFANNWEKNFSAQDLRLNGWDYNHYLNKGVKFLIDYHKKHRPFTENTVAIEKKIVFPLDEEGIYNIQGYIDRIVKAGEKEFEVHDYKTNDIMKTQEQVDMDRQLALYHLGLQHEYGKDIKVKLVWHFLAHDKSIMSTRTQEQLEQLRHEVLELIKRIESNTKWPCCGKRWCDWCSYKQKNAKNLFRN